MIKKVKFPEDIIPHKYYNVHALYLRHIFEASDVQLEIAGDTTVSSGFTIDIDGTTIFIDYSDHPRIFRKGRQYRAYFKYHYAEQHKELENIFPLAPVSFYNWSEFYTLRKKIDYTANTDIILNNQKPYGNAAERRRFVQKLLREKYGVLLETNHILPQYAYWKKANNCLVHVFVPGARNDMLDRGQLQYMAFGCCTLSPPISDILPYYKKPIPGIHYVQVESDYSNLIDRVEWCKSNRKKCIEIGRAAQKLFDETCIPTAIMVWIERCLYTIKDLA
jgi:hypothetical protein